ncbi:MAG: sugar phosphate isomerase/epimerase [Clostridia bacterium]|nr:sugar phosphate isomerase/epimerase [Clostridia bacterium]
MYKTKLCLGIDGSFELAPCDQIRLFQSSGFDGFFTGWSDDVKKYRILADNIGMTYQSIHAPFGKAAKMWTRSDEARAAVDELLLCVRACSELDVPILVVHPYIGFEAISNPTKEGISNFRRVVEDASRRGVTIAFENVEGEEYLAALMGAFAEYGNVGFCWDSGHELCYNRGKDMLALYGDRLVATHLNDNLGVSNFDGKITFTDDLHLLPFDGVHDWVNIAKRLNKCGYCDILTFELTRKSKPNRPENHKYQKMSIEEYIAEVYARACRLAYMKQCTYNLF